MWSNIEKIPVIERGSLIIDRQCSSVIINGKTIFLHAKEMQLLCLLAEHPGWVLTKKQIFDSIYEDSLEIDDFYINNRIYCLVRNLRKKIEINSKRPRYIQTIKNIGYRFTASEE